MKRFPAFLLALFLALPALAPSAARAVEYDRYGRPIGEPPPPPPPAPPYKPVIPYRPPAYHLGPYFGFHIGAFEPNEDYSDFGYGSFDTGFLLDMLIGSRISPVFAVEGAMTFYGSDNGPFALYVMPLTFGGRLILPNPVVEPYVAGGIGLYFSSVEYPYLCDVFGCLIATEDETNFGGYLGGGADFWLTPTFALNVDGRYHYVDKVGPIDADASGWAIGFGIRVGF